MKKKKRRSTPTQRSFWIVMVAVVLFYIIYNTRGGEVVTVPGGAPLAENEIRVHFIDVGQGDSILIQTLQNAVLIDGGEYSARDKLMSYLKGAGVDALDIVVATHPHSDHIGGLPSVMDSYRVGRLLMPDTTANTASFEKLLDAVEANGIPITVPSPGERFNAGLIELSALAPNTSGNSNVNNDSIVLRMVYGETGFLFTGDAEVNSEREMLDSGNDLRASVLKAGHHGSATASGAGFLRAVNPTAVVISCGEGNSYGHPHEEALERITAAAAHVYRTDLDGSIVMDSDGGVIRIYKDE